MKRFVGTFVFAVFVIAVAGFAYWDYKNNQKEEAAKLEEGRVLEFDVQNVTEIRLKRSDSELHLEKQEDGSWQILKPVEDEADTENVKTWLEDMLDQKVKDLTASAKTVEKENSKTVDWSKYYLGPDSKVLRLTAGDKSTSLQFSDSSAFDGSFYIKKEDRLFLGDLSWAGSLERTAESLRSKDIYEPKAEIIGLTLEKRGRKDIKLERDEMAWKLTGKNQPEISQAKVEDYIEELKSLTALEIVSDELTSKALSQANLSSPEFTLTVFEKGVEKPFKLYIGKKSSEKMEVSIYSTKRPTIYKASSAAVEKLMITEDFFRDGKMPFQFNDSEIDKIKILAKGSERIFAKENGSWKATQIADDEEFRPGKVAGFLLSIKELEAKVFLGEKTQEKSLGKERIELFSADKSLLTLNFGGEFKSEDVPLNINPLKYVRSSLHPELLGVRAPSVSSIIQQLPVALKKVENKEVREGAPQTQPQPGEDHHGHSH